MGKLEIAEARGWKAIYAFETTVFLFFRGTKIFTPSKKTLRLEIIREI